MQIQNCNNENQSVSFLVNDTLKSLDAFLIERGRVYDIYGIKKPNTLNEFEKSLSAFDIIKTQNSELIDAQILKSGAWDKNNDDPYRLIQELAKYQKVADVLNKFNPSIYHANIDRIIYELNELSHKKFRFFKGNQHLELVERYYNYPVQDDINTIIDSLGASQISDTSLIESLVKEADSVIKETISKIRNRIFYIVDTHFYLLREGGERYV